MNSTRKHIALFLVICLLGAMMPLNNTIVSSASKKINVSISNCPTGKLVIKKGDKYTLDVEAKGCSLSFSSNKSKIVSVNKTGIVTAKKAGKAKISVIAQKGKLKTKKSISVNVVTKTKYKPVDDLKIIYKEDYLFVGEKTKLKVQFNPEDRTLLETENSAATGSSVSLNSDSYNTEMLENGVSNSFVTFSSSNKKVLDVSANGVITAKKKGFADVTATSCADKTKTYTVAFSVFSKKDLKDSDNDGYTDTEEEYMETDPLVADKTVDIKKLRNKTVYSDGVSVVDMKDSGITRADAKKVENKDPEKNKLKNKLVLPSNTSGIKKGAKIIIKPCKAYPSGAALKVTSYKKRSDGNYLVTGKVPAMKEVIRYANGKEHLRVDMHDIDLNKQFKKSTKVRKMGSGEASIGDSISIGDDGTLSFTYKDPEDEDNSITGWIRINDVDADYHIGIFSKSYAYVNINGDAGFDIKREFGTEKDITLGSLPVAGALGTGVFIDLILHIGIKGEISLSYSINFDTGVNCGYENGRDDGLYFDINKREMNVDGKLEAYAGLKLEANAKVFGFKIASMGIEPGIRLTLESPVEHAPMQCNNGFTRPSVTCRHLHGDFYVDLYAALDILDISYTYEFDPIRLLNVHWENRHLRPDGVCTWFDEAPGLYDSYSGELIESFDDLKAEGKVKYEIKDGTLLLSEVSGDLEGKLKLPDDTPDIGAMAFSKCHDLTGIFIPGSVKKIGDHAFYGCNDLHYVFMENGVEELGPSAFLYLKDLGYVELPDTLKKIGVSCFADCYNLESLYIPKGVSKISILAFPENSTVYYGGSRKDMDSCGISKNGNYDNCGAKEFKEEVDIYHYTPSWEF